mgnify:CR=1 FL=1
MSDSIVPYGDNDRYLGVEKQLNIWKDKKSCTSFDKENEKYNFLTFSFYNQTDEMKWYDCNFHDEVKLWKMNGAGHISIFSRFFMLNLFLDLGVENSE